MCPFLGVSAQRGSTVIIFSHNIIANLPSLVVSLLLGVKGHRHPTSVESRDDVIVTEFVKIHA